MSDKLIGSVISIHALLAESDFFSSVSDSLPALFLSTLSLRRATARKPSIQVQHPLFLSTLSLRRATYVPVWALRVTSISIHALLAESDAVSAELRVFPVDYFYPRSPCGERHRDKLFIPPAKKISIHALLAESDVKYTSTGLNIFISIHALLAESDTEYGRAEKNQGISIHALLAESDNRDIANGEREKHISIHALLAESDVTSSTVIVILRISIHALLAESD